MKQIKLVLKRILIIYVIIFVTLSSMSSCLARGYDDKCGEFLVEKTKEFIQKYQSVSYYLAEQEVTWTGGELGKGDLYVCCTSGVKYMYELYLGVNLYDLGYSALSDDNLNPPSQYWDKIPVSEAKPLKWQQRLEQENMLTLDQQVHMPVMYTHMEIHLQQQLD